MSEEIDIPETLPGEVSSHGKTTTPLGIGEGNVEESITAFVKRTGAALVVFVGFGKPFMSRAIA
jgi:hypothetical protein